MASIRTTQPKSQIFKYMESTVESIESSMSEGKNIDASNGSFRVKDNKVNRAVIEEFIKLVAKKTIKDSDIACKLTLDVTGGKVPKGGLPIGNIEKPRKPSKGDIGEAVIAAAICARFVYKHGKVTPRMVMQIMKTLGHKGIKNYSGKKGKYVEGVFKSKNEGVKILDDVHCYISLNQSAITAALKPRSEFGQWAYSDRTIIPAYAQSACNYVNGGKVSKWAETVYTNKRYDKIDIKSDGLSDQKGTKVDTRVQITDYQGVLQPVNINLSMKVDDIGQFGQVSGMEFSVQQELWKQVFGYTSTVNSLETKWNELSQVKHDLKGALNMVYDAVYKKAKQDIQGPGKEKLVKTIAKALQYFATRHEEHVEMLNLGKGGTKFYSFEDTESVLMNVEDFDITIRDQKNGYRQIGIVGRSPKDNKVKEIIQVRLRRQPEESKGPISYIRNLIEKRPLLGELLAESL